MSLWLTIVGGTLTSIWGAAHIVPTRSVVRGFGDLAPDNRRTSARRRRAVQATTPSRPSRPS